MLTASTIVVASKDVISSDLSGEAVMLDLHSGTYFGLNAVGAEIWTLIQEPRSVEDIVSMLQQEYVVERERCFREVLTLLNEMASRGLVELRDENPS